MKTTLASLIISSAFVLPSIAQPAQAVSPASVVDATSQATSRTDSWLCKVLHINCM